MEKVYKRLYTKNFISKTKVYYAKIYKKVYTEYDGVGSKNSVYITLSEARKKISNFNKRIELLLLEKLNYNGFSNTVLFIPVVNNDYLDVYIHDEYNIYDVRKIKDYLDGQFHVIGEGGIYINYKKKEYLVII